MNTQRILLRSVSLGTLLFLYLTVFVLVVFSFNVSQFSAR